MHTFMLFFSTVALQKNKFHKVREYSLFLSIKNSSSDFLFYLIFSGSMNLNETIAYHNLTVICFYVRTSLCKLGVSNAFGKSADVK